MNKPINHATYTLTLNDRGGIENDFTVTRLAEDEFFIVTGASATKYVLTLLRKIIIAEDGEASRCDLCGMYTMDMAKHQRTKTCKKNQERRKKEKLLDKQVEAEKKIFLFMERSWRGYRNSDI